MTIKTSEEDVFACLSDIPQTQINVAERAGIHRSNITGWLHKLESKGLAKKTSVGQWVLSPTQQAQQHNNTTIKEDVDNDIEAREAFFTKFFKEFYPEIDPEVNPDLAFIRLVGSFELVYDSRLATLTWFAIDHTDFSVDDIGNLKEYMLKKAKEQ